MLYLNFRKYVFIYPVFVGFAFTMWKRRLVHKLWESFA